VSEQSTRAPRETVIRAFTPGFEFRAAGDIEGDELGPGYLGLLRIRFSPVDEWTEINSAWEGRFLERFAPGAWRKTIKESAERVRALFQHGQDPQIGDKPLGPIRALEENESGGYGEVALMDTAYNRELLPGLKEGLYGASHRFSTVREEEVMSPEPSDHNPHGLPERTIKEARLFEFGPVTFPAYAGASASVRSMTDDFLISCFRSDPDRLRSMFDRATDLSQPAERATQDTAPSPDDAALTGTSAAPERRDQGHSVLIPSTERRRRSVLDV
jgi:HK97 family phage prohead protease